MKTASRMTSDEIRNAKYPHTPEYISGPLPRNEIFVFGSNLAGIHGAGAAKMAHDLYGAEMGIGIGRTGQCYAIATKDRELKTLSLDKITGQVKRFYYYAAFNPQLLFLVTPIGCGLAGYQVSDIAPLFYKYPRPDNVVLPRSFLEWKSSSSVSSSPPASSS